MLSRPRSPSRLKLSGRIGLVMASMLLTAAIWLSPAAELESGAGLRLLYALRGVVPAPQDIVIVALDSASAQAFGLSDRPGRWPRGIHARLVSGLAARGAKVIGFDLLFSQPREDADDLALSEAVRRAGNVVLAEVVSREAIKDPDGRTLATADRRVLPLPQFADAAIATAPFVMPKTPDGVIEFWTVVPAIGDLPSLPTVMAGRMRQDGQERAAPAGGFGSLVRRLSADPMPRRVLNLHGPLGTIRTIPYARALELIDEPGAGAAAFAGKAVLVGYSESNQSKQIDAYRTPYSTADGLDVSGVELCATALANLLQDSWLRRPGLGASLGLLTVHAGLLALPWALWRPRTAAALTVGLGLSWAWGAHLAFADGFVWLPVIVPLAFSPLIAASLGMAARYRADQRQRAELEQAVELGLPRRAMERLSAVLGDVGGGRTVSAVCLCTDIVGYTTLSETLSPEGARDALNRYFARFVPIIEDHDGYVTDMVGDSVLALWIADPAPERAFASACDAALALDRAMNESTAPGALPTRLGLHCGPIYFGEVGADGRREIRAVGDIVNTSSRIQGANKYLGTRVLASGEVAGRLDSGVRRHLGRFLLVGKAQALELLELSHEPLPEPVGRHFALGLAAFAAADIAAAAAHFAAARAAGDAGPSDFYVDQCRRLSDAPPDPAWCGAVSMPGK